MTAPIRKKPYIPLIVTISLAILLLAFGSVWMIAGLPQYLIYGLYIVFAQVWFFRTAYSGKRSFMFSNIPHFIYLGFTLIYSLLQAYEEFIIGSLQAGVVTLCLLALQFYIIKKYRA